MSVRNLNLETKFLLGIGSVVCLLILLLFFWMSQRLDRQILDQVDKQAKILWTQLVLNQQWVAENPDVVVELPIMVTKKLSRMAEGQGIYRFRITSLLPVNPENAPNDFEREALREFEKGSKEASRVEIVDGVKVYRYMAPLYVTDACLTCHAYQGYAVGDVRGGLSVMIPMQEADDAIASNRLLLTLSAFVVLGLVLGALYTLIRRLVLRPVQHLHAVAMQIESGNYATRARLTTGDELERLGNAFNRMLAAIAEARSFDEAVLENVPSGVLTVDREGRLTFVNRTAVELFGMLSAGEVAHLKKELLQSDEGQPIDPLRKREASLHREMKLSRKDGGHITVSVCTSPLLDGDGEAVGAVGVITDLTEIKAMDEQKAHLDRLAALGQLSGSIAHEINNPLQGITSGLSLIGDPTATQTQKDLYLEIIREEVERIAKAIQQMLDFYRPPSDARAPVDINGVVQSVLALSGKQLQHSGIEVICEMDEGLPKIIAVSSQVRQVFLNVVLNAVEAMSQGGHLKVVTRLANGIQAAEPRRALIEVSDTGIGIPPEQLHRIFDPFYTTKPRGTGLGLSVSYSIVKSHGGAVRVESREGEGTTFVIELPVDPEVGVDGKGNIQCDSISDAWTGAGR